MGCTNLKSIYIPRRVNSIEGYTFSKCSSELVISCYKDSKAHSYAVENEIKYVLLDDTQIQTYMCADADLDGAIAIKDATHIQKHLAGIKVEGDMTGTIITP